MSTTGLLTTCWQSIAVITFYLFRLKTHRDGSNDKVWKRKPPHWFLCPVRRPLSEYVRSSEESGCKCHVYMSICNHFPSAKHEESAMQRSKATATGQDSECLEHCESANGAKQCAASHCMVLWFLSKSQIYKKGGVILWDTKDCSDCPLCPIPLWGGNLVMQPSIMQPSAPGSA